MKWKPLPLPNKDCMYQGTVKCCNKPVCDSIGDDVSNEFCHYCRYYSKVMNVKPYEFAEKFHNHLQQIEDEFKSHSKTQAVKKTVS